MRVLMSVEKRHRAYGEAVAEAIGALRPHLKVSVADPERFEEELARLGPELVLCDRPDPEKSGETLAWVASPVDADRPTTVRVGGRRREILNPSFIELLAIVDEVRTLTRTITEVA